MSKGNIRSEILIMSAASIITIPSTGLGGTCASVCFVAYFVWIADDL